MSLIENLFSRSKFNITKSTLLESFLCFLWFFILFSLLVYDFFIKPLSYFPFLIFGLLVFILSIASIPKFVGQKDNDLLGPHLQKRNRTLLYSYLVLYTILAILITIRLFL